MAERSSTKIRFGIFSRLLVSMLLVSIVPLLTVWYTNYDGTMDRLEQETRENMAQKLDKLTSYVDGWVDMNYRMLIQNATLPEMESMRAEKQDPILKTITDQYPWAYLAFTVAKHGNNVGRSDGKPRKFYGDRKYVQDVLAGSPVSHQVLIGKTSGKPAFVMSAPIHASPTVAGVIAIAMTVDEMSQEVVEARIGETGSAFLVDEDGKVIAHESEEYTKTRADLSSHPAVMAAKEGKTQSVFSDESGRRVVAAASSTDKGWTLVVQQDYDEAFADLSKTNRNAFILLALTVFPVILIAYFVSRSLSVPIRNLTEIADSISMGEMDLEIQEVSRKDELGVLASAIERLRASMELAMARIGR